jgi:hypothetical protein
MMQIAIFPTKSEMGHELANAVQKLTSQWTGCEVVVYQDGNPWQFFQACMNCDVVILDATIEDDLDQSNYSFATPLNIERLLVVGRSYTPINFRGILEGGTAKYSDPETERGQKPNELIIDWLRQQIPKVVEHAHRRPLFQRLLSKVPYLNLVADQFRSIGARRALLGQRAFTFLSYRSTHIDEVQALAEQRRTEHSQNARLFFFDPGELVYEDEVLSPLRRWQLLSLIQDYLIAAKEIWLYLSDDYLESWWTVGEVLSSLEFILSAKLRLYDPHTMTAMQPDLSRLPALSEVDKRRMAHLQANSHPDEFAPETLDRNKMLAPLKDVSMVRKLFMLDAPAFSDEFWFLYILPCRRWAQHVSKPYGTDVFDLFYQACQRIDVDRFLRLIDTAEPEDATVLILSESDLRRAAQGETTLVCPQCQNLIKVTQLANPRYFWVPQPDAAHGNKTWGRLDPLPVFRANCQGT